MNPKLTLSSPPPDHSGLDMTHSVDRYFTISLPKENLVLLIFKVPQGLFPVFLKLSTPLILSHRWFVRHAGLYCFCYYKKTNRAVFFQTVKPRKLGRSVGVTYWVAEHNYIFSKKELCFFLKCLKFLTIIIFRIMSLLCMLWFEFSLPLRY